MRGAGATRATRLGLDRNTIVVYASDHGEMLGDLGLWNKFQFYEGSCGVPLFFRVPGGTPGLCKTPVSLVSLTATIAEMCNVPVTAPKAGPLDGESFADLVRKPDATIDHGPVFAEYNLGESSAKYMIREGSYKYTFWADDIDELYDLSNDRRRCTIRPPSPAIIRPSRDSRPLCLPGIAHRRLG